jgi:hypothetical protein
MTRASRDLVEAILNDGFHQWPLLDDLCRDWLDMQERERRLVAAEADASNLRRMFSVLAGDLHDGSGPYETLDQLATVIEYLLAPEEATDD